MFFEVFKKIKRIIDLTRWNNLGSCNENISHCVICILTEFQSDNLY